MSAKLIAVRSVMCGGMSTGTSSPELIYPSDLCYIGVVLTNCCCDLTKDWYEGGNESVCVCDGDYDRDTVVG